MNYTCMRADCVSIGNIVYHPIRDATLIWVQKAGDLHLVLYYPLGRQETVRRDCPVLVQVCHRRHYETSVHHRRIDPGKALLRVYRKRIAPLRV